MSKVLNALSRFQFLLISEAGSMLFWPSFAVMVHVGHVEMRSILENLRHRKRELDSEVERVKALIVRLNSAPVEMRRHHGLVFESSTFMKRAVDRLERYLSTNDGLQPLLADMYDASATLRDRMKAIVALCNTREPVSHDVLRPVSTAALHACKSFLDSLAEVRSEMRVVVDDGKRACNRLSFRAEQVRASADAILRNLSADDAEDNVRHAHEHLGEFDY